MNALSRDCSTSLWNSDSAALDIDRVMESTLDGMESEVEDDAADAILPKPGTWKANSSSVSDSSSEDWM